MAMTLICVFIACGSSKLSLQKDKVNEREKTSTIAQVKSTEVISDTTRVFAAAWSMDLKPVDHSRPMIIIDGPDTLKVTNATLSTSRSVQTQESKKVAIKSKDSSGQKRQNTKKRSSTKTKQKTKKGVSTGKAIALSIIFILLLIIGGYLYTKFKRKRS